MENMEKTEEKKISSFPDHEQIPEDIFHGLKLTFKTCVNMVLKD